MSGATLPGPARLTVTEGKRMDLIDRMLEHDRWATNTLLEICRGLDDAQLDQEFDIGHRTLRATFAHIVINIEFWTGLMEGRQVDYAPPDDASLAELFERHGRAYDAFAARSRRLRDEARLDETYVDHYEARKSMAGTILHVALHDEGHRTELVHMLARLGIGEAPEVDFGLWDYLQHNAESDL
jgi:uncharacterized damage-inducible protein DinB